MNISKNPLTGVIYKSYFEKFLNILRKTLTAFNFIRKETPTQVCSQEFCKYFQNKILLCCNTDLKNPYIHQAQLKSLLKYAPYVPHLRPLLTLLFLHAFFSLLEMFMRWIYSPSKSLNFLRTKALQTVLFLCMRVKN